MYPLYQCLTNTMTPASRMHICIGYQVGYDSPTHPVLFYLDYNIHIRSFYMSVHIRTEISPDHEYVGVL